MENRTASWNETQNRPNKEIEVQKCFTILILIISFIGFALNLLAAILFYRTPSKGNFLLLLFLLSSVESVYGSSFFVIQSFIYMTMSLEMTVSTNLFSIAGSQFTIHVIRFVSRTSLFCRNWFIVLIAWMRFLVVCYPLRSQRIGKGQVKIFALLIVSICVILTVPRIFESGIVVQPSGKLNYTLFTIIRTPGYTKFYLPVYHFLVSPLASLIILFCSLSIILQVRKRNNQFADDHRTVSSSPTKTVLILCLIFTICEIPRSIFSVVDFIIHNSGGHFYIFDVLTDLGNLLSSLDSVLNFVAYFYSGIKHQLV